MIGKFFVKQAIVLLFIVTLVGCTGNAIVQPTETLVATFSAPPTTEMTQSPTAVPSPTPVFVDSRETFSPGMYAIYWNKNTWYIKGLGESEARVLIPNATNDLYTEMELSPDGNLVAFSDAGGRISIYDFRTGETKSFTNSRINEIMEIIWSNDGKILYYSGTIEIIWRPEASTGLFWISLETEETSNLLELWDRKFQLRGLALSKDDRWLAFYAPTLSEIMAEDPKYVVYLMDTNCINDFNSCANSTELIGDGHRPAWSPDGKLSWVCSSNALCMADVDSAEITKQVFLTTDDLGMTTNASFGHFSWSPDGRYLAINLEESQSGSSETTADVFIYSLQEKRLINITNTPDQDEHSAGWSSDSKYLAFERYVGVAELIESLGFQFAIYDTYIYDVETGQIIDQILSAGNRQGFNFFMTIE